MGYGVAGSNVLVVSALGNLLHECARCTPGLVVRSLVDFSLHLCVVQNDIFTRKTSEKEGSFLRVAERKHYTLLKTS